MSKRGTSWTSQPTACTASCSDMMCLFLCSLSAGYGLDLRQVPYGSGLYAMQLVAVAAVSVPTKALPALKLCWCVHCAFVANTG